jgi:hypothetical protein
MYVALTRAIIAALYSVGFLVSITSASSSQLTPQEKEQAVTTLSSEINSSIQKQLSFPYLRDKVVRRVAECAFLFKTLEDATRDPKVKKSFAEASDLSQEVAVLIEPPRDCRRLFCLSQANFRHSHNEDLGRLMRVKQTQPPAGLSSESDAERT